MPILTTPLCRFCIKEQKECNYYKEAHKTVHNTELKGSFKFHCFEYYNILAVDTPVKIEVFDRYWEEKSSGNNYDEPMENWKYPSWISKGWVKGKITDHNGPWESKPRKNGFIYIKLDKPIKLVLKHDENKSDIIQEELVYYRKKRLNKIKVL